MLFLLSLIFFCMPLISMEFDLPSHQKGLTEAEKEYYQEIEAKFKNYFKQTLCTQYAEENPNDLTKTPMIERFDTVVRYHAILLHDFRTKNTAQKLSINIHDAEDALRYVLSQRRLITFIARGTIHQPLMVRPEFDQQWSKIYQEVVRKTKFDHLTQLFSTSVFVEHGSSYSAITPERICGYELGRRTPKPGPIIPKPLPVSSSSSSSDSDYEEPSCTRSYMSAYLDSPYI